MYIKIIKSVSYLCLRTAKYIDRWAGENKLTKTQLTKLSSNISTPSVLDDRRIYSLCIWVCVCIYSFRAFYVLVT